MLSKLVINSHERVAALSGAAVEVARRCGSATVRSNWIMSIRAVPLLISALALG